MKKIILVVLGGLGLLLIAAFVAVYIIMFSPFTIPPQIGRGLPSDFRVAAEEFSARVDERFVGTNAATMREELGRQGFELKNDPYGDGGTLAYFKKQSFPCVLSWNIYWKSTGNTVDDLRANYGSNCL